MNAHFTVILCALRAAMAAGAAFPVDIFHFHYLEVLFLVSLAL